MAGNKNYIGYGTLEEWARKAEQGMLDRPSANTYTTLTRQTGGGNPPITNLVGTVARIDEHGDVHYWRMRLASFLDFGGAPFPQDQQNIERAHVAWGLIKDWLNAHHVQELVDAEVAVPKDMRPLEGGTEFLRYSKESGWTTAEEA